MARAAAKTTTKKLPAKRVAVAASPVAKISKDELRAQVAKLELTVKTLRAKSREAVRHAKEDAARIGELEDHVAQLEKRMASQSAAASRGKEVSPGRGRRKSRDIDPGDAVPPGVAVEAPEPMDQEAETAFDNLEDHLHS